jgi:hypothetical protein
VAQQSGVPVWAVVGRGRRLPPRMLDALLERVAAEHGEEPWRAADEAVPAVLLDAIVGPAGPVEVAVGLATADCPEAPELLRSVPRL